MGKRDNVQLAVRTTHKIRERLMFPLIAQPKLNGVRGLISYKQEGDMFSDGEVYIESSEGNRYRIPHIEDEMLDFFKENPKVIIDGEIYIHGEPLNKILRRIPKTNSHGTVSTNSLPIEDLQFHMFDVKDNSLTQSKRLTRLQLLTMSEFNTDIIKIVPSEIILNLIELEDYLDYYISMGYEGIILRYPNSLYTSGRKKVKVMLKWKKAEDTECEILDIISEGIKNNVYVIKFLLKNDFNDETFLCNVGDDDGASGAWTNEVKEFTYRNRLGIIGKMATVKFYERSGVKKVPFHANVITIRDYE